MIDVTTRSGRTGKALVEATRPFAHDTPAKTWWCFVTTYGLLLGLLVGAGAASWWPARLGFSVLGAMLMVRSFILYHDFMHGSILRESWLARVLFYGYGSLALVPPRSWRHSHNYHHAKVGTITGSGVGSFPLMTTDMWRRATAGERFKYRIMRHPVAILFAYVTVFLVNITLLPLLRHPGKHWDSAISLAAHGALVATLWAFAGFQVLFFSLLLPMTLASALGGYLFFAQHNFQGMRVMEPEEWDYVHAALESSSYMKLGRIMSWLTGNIGYHHVHHLNLHIPFYRLPEAMAAIPELQCPSMTSLDPGDIVNCFRLNLWDPARKQMVSYREGGRTPAG